MSFENEDIMWKRFSLLCIFTLLLFACNKSALLDRQTLSSLNFPNTKSTQIIFFEKNFKLEKRGKLIENLHVIYKIGDETKSLSDFAIVFDGAIRKLKNYELRVIRADGKSFKFTTRNLKSMPLMTESYLSTNKILYIDEEKNLEKNDLVEIISGHENNFPALGVIFQVNHNKMKVSNVKCEITIPSDYELQYKVKNSTISPTIKNENGVRCYSFFWKSYSSATGNSFFRKSNHDPMVLAVMPFYQDNTSHKFLQLRDWKDFTNWYMNLIKPKLECNQEIVSIAERITKDSNSPYEKMDAILQYVQKEIRYEKNYLDYGEIIPNDVQTIFARKYGDCKDYSALIYTMATCIGLNPNFVLCNRSKNYEIDDEIPVEQFNHLLIHMRCDGKDYWYDGTNRTGIPGLTTRELIGQKVLAFNDNYQEFIRIKDSPDNKLHIKGNFELHDLDLMGHLDIYLFNQNAVDFYYADFYLNETKMADYILNWMKKNIHDRMIVKKLTWKNRDGQFIISADCSISNTAAMINGKIYLTGKRIFANIFPDKKLPDNLQEIFCFPSYNHVKINLNFQNLLIFNADLNEWQHSWYFDFSIPSGPFYENHRQQFVKIYKDIKKRLNKQLICKRG